MNKLALQLHGFQQSGLHLEILLSDTLLFRIINTTTADIIHQFRRIHAFDRLLNCR